MRIGIVTTWFERGAAYVSKQFKQVLELSGHEVFIYARAGEHTAEGDPNWDGPEVTWGKRVFGGHATRVDIPEFKKWIKSTQLETVLFNEQFWIPALTEARKLNVKVGAYVDFYKRNTVHTFELYDFVICNTKRHYSVFNWHPQAHYVPWGTDTSLFSPSDDLSVGDEVKFFFSAGMDPVNRKGGEYLIRAMDLLKEESCRLIIHSQVPLHPLLNEEDSKMLDRLVEQKKIELIIKTVPAPGLFTMGDVYVYPTKLEGIGLSIIEALSCGLPIIVPNNGPMKEFVVPKAGSTVNIEEYYGHENGYFWPLCKVSIEDLAHKMKQYIIHKEEIPEMKKNARNYALKERNWLNNQQVLDKIFTESTIQEVDLNKFSIMDLRDEFSPKELLRKVRQDLTRIFVKKPSKFFHVS